MGFASAPSVAVSLPPRIPKHRSNGQPRAAYLLVRFARITVLNEKLLEVMGDNVTQEQARSCEDGTPTTC